MKRKTSPAPTDEDILKLNDVPVDVAASYIGKSTPTIYAALQDERAPFGFAVQNKVTGTWTYSVSPGALVKYKHGELQIYHMKELQKLMSESVEEIISARMERLKQVFSAVMTS